MLAERVSAHGFASIRQLVTARQAATYASIAAELGSDIAPAQVEIFHLEDCALHSAFAEGVAESLARHIRAELREGWGNGRRVEYRTASALADWLAHAMHDVEQDTIPRATLEAIPRVLRDEVRPPLGWLPMSGRDPLIQRAFEIAMRVKSIDA